MISLWLLAEMCDVSCSRVIEAALELRLIRPGFKRSAVLITEEQATQIREYAGFVEYYPWWRNPEFFPLLNNPDPSRFSAPKKAHKKTRRKKSEQKFERLRVNTPNINNPRIDKIRRDRQAVEDRKTSTGVVVYFVLARELNRMKIGITKEILGRMQGLNNSSPTALELIGTIPGSIDIEAALHRRFAEYRHRLEWFRFEGALRSYVAELFPGSTS